MAHNVQIGDWEGAVEYCKELLELLDELPEAAEGFSSDVHERVLSIMTWIEENEHITERQIHALEHMKEGAEKWIS